VPHPITDFLNAAQAVVVHEWTTADVWRQGGRPARGQRRRLLERVQHCRKAAEYEADARGKGEVVNEVLALCVGLQSWDRPVAEAVVQWAGVPDEHREAMQSQALLLAEEAQAHLVCEMAVRLERLAPPDGPADGNVLRWKGRQVKLQPRPWRILAYLWDRRSAPANDLEIPVWGHEGVTTDALKSALYHLNRPLAEEGVPITVRQQGGAVWLDRPA
jgi:hypothetical protein